ncbi:MAG: hypothetical protein ACE14M_07945 [Terriglobales bacterium]
MKALRSYRTLLAIAILLAGVYACSKKQEEGSSGTKPVRTGETAISGTITLDPSLKDKVGQNPLLLIFASTSSDPSRPALVVKREVAVNFPLEYKITPADIVLVGSPFRGDMYVSARIDPAGMVGPPRAGTFGGSYPGNPVPVGSSKVDIVINKAY